MRVDDHSAGNAVADPQFDVGRLAADPGQFDQVLDIPGKLTAVIGDQALSHSLETLGLGTEKPGRLHDPLDVTDPPLGQRLSRRKLLEKRWRHHVDTFVGTLCREDRGG